MSPAWDLSTSGGVIRQFLDRSGDYGLDVAREIAWRGRFAHVGVHAGWRSGAWALRGGCVLHAAQRDAVDTLLVAHPAPVYRHNHLLTLESAHPLTAKLALFAQANCSSNLFLSDLRVIYNSTTSTNFGSPFAVLSLGLRAGF